MLLAQREAAQDPVTTPVERSTAGWEDLAVVASYLFAAIYVLGGLLRHTGQGRLELGGLDQTQMEWFLAHFAHALTHLNNPLFATVGNAPLGINLMANASVTGLALPLTPITLAFGAEVSFTVAMLAGLTASAAAWYWLFSRHLVGSRAAAAVAGGFCGFAPAVISHAGGAHLNFVSLFLLPVIVWRAMKLREPGRSLRNGLILALLCGYQFFIGEEPLLITALGLAVFLAVYAVARPAVARAAARPFVTASAVAFGFLGLLLGYPIWLQFFGPQSYSRIKYVGEHGNDVMALGSYAGQSLAGWRPLPHFVSRSPGEENAHVGWSLLVLAVLLAAWLWRESVTARAAAITAAVALFASLGPRVEVAGTQLSPAGPWAWADRIPGFGSLLPTRLAMIAIPAIAVLLALGIDKAIRMAPLRVWCAGLLAAVLLPLVPRPLPITDRPPVPAFFADGTWRDYAGPGRSIVSAIPHNNGYGEPMRWQVAAGMGFTNVAGYFVGPVDDDRQAWYTPPDRPLAALFKKSIEDGATIVASGQMLAQAHDDLRCWRADAIVLAADLDHLRQTVSAIAGPGRIVGGVHVWDVRPITHGS